MPRKHTPEITYIVSACNRPELLPCLLWSLKVQSNADFEVIIADNSDVESAAVAHKKYVEQLKDDRFRIVRTAKKTKVNDCYWAGEYIAEKEARGRWLCFPCDDCYYAPDFGRKMLNAAYMNSWDMVFSKIVLSQLNLQYAVIENPGPHFSVKTSFIIRADSFPGFKGKPNSPSPSCADRVLGQALAKSGIRWGVVPEVMVIHN